jgi:hypothetical protein
VCGSHRDWPIHSRKAPALPEAGTASTHRLSLLVMLSPFVSP